MQTIMKGEQYLSKSPSVDFSNPIHPLLTFILKLYAMVRMAFKIVPPAFSRATDKKDTEDNSQIIFLISQGKHIL